MSYPRILQRVFHSAWAIERSWLGTMFALLHSRILVGDSHDTGLPARARGTRGGPAWAPWGPGGGERSAHVGVSRWAPGAGGRLANLTLAAHERALQAAIRGEEIDPQAYEQALRAEEAAMPAGQILHVFASGIMGKHLSMMEEICAGGLSVDRLQEALRLARDDEKVAAVMLHLDTPGGVVTGVPETAALIGAVRDAGKVVAAFSDSMTASAGYWCASAAAAIYVTPSADVGSVGVYTAIVDYAEWCAKQGIKVELVRDGVFKGMGYPGTTLTPEQRALIEADVQQVSAMFKGHVRAARPGVGDDLLQGQCFIGARAVSAGLADALVNDLAEAMEDLARAI